MRRRHFLQAAAAAPLMAAHTEVLPRYRVVTSYNPSKGNGFPGPFPGRVVHVHSERAVDESANRIDPAVVSSMLLAGMRELTGKADARDAWAAFFAPHDVVGIKVNCSGAPAIHSSPELVRAVVDNLLAVGIPAQNICVYDRFDNQLRIVNYPDHLPSGITVVAGESSRGSILGYDPCTYVEVDFFGEEDTRSNLIRAVSERFTKVINIPTMKEHRASGVTGCLKNISYGNFSNVARSHQSAKTNTYSFIGTLASVEPVRSRTVLNVMDGLRSLWQGGPFLQSRRFLFYPKLIAVGTDPVALDHLLIEMLETKRASEGAPSLFDRSDEHLKHGPETDPNFNSFIREPGHVKYAGQLGLGVYSRSSITHRLVQL